ncbi:MAG TPA: ATP-binding protein [Roseiflexaceae bacterium]|nr:ATP-binding protein [Roseiflexaceae bacterium]
MLRTLRTGRATQALLPYAIAVGAVAAALLASLLLMPLVVSNPFLLFFAAVALTAWYGGLGPSVCAIALATIASATFLIPPYGALPSSPMDLARLGGFMLVAGLISTLSELRRRAVGRTYEEAERLVVTLRSIGDAVITADAEGCVTMLNPVAEELTGWTSADAQGMPLSTVFQIIDEGTRRPVENPVVRVLREGVIVGLANHTLLVARDGTTRPIDDSSAPIRDSEGRIIGVVLVFRDVAERRRAELDRERLIEQTRQAQQHAEAERQHLAGLLVQIERAVDRTTRLQNITAALSTALTPPQVAATVVDQGIAALEAHSGALGLLREDGQMIEIVYNRNQSDWVSQRFASFPLAADMPFAEAVRTGELICLADQDERRRRYPRLGDALDGSGLHASISVPLPVDGRPIGALGILFAERHDFSAEEQALMRAIGHLCAQAINRARLFAAEQRAHKEAEAAVQLRDQFLSVASHELKTPLTSLLMQTQLVQRRALREGSLSERDQRALQVITDQAHRLDRMISAMLDISRLELGQLTIVSAPVDLDRLARRVIGELQPTTDQHTIRYQGPEQTLVITGDDLRLEQVLQNLIQNAIKYSPSGGEIAVRIEAAADRARLSVSDQGIGIPPEALARLFTRFYRAANADPRQISGMGIGLYVVKEIVTLHGGSITVSSSEGQGSTFTIELPLDRQSDQINQAT